MSYTSLSLSNLASGETGYIAFDADSGFKVLLEVTLNGNSYFKDITTGTSSNLTTVASTVIANGSYVRDISSTGSSDSTGNFSSLADQVGASIKVGDIWLRITKFINNSLIAVDKTVSLNKVTAGFTVASPSIISTTLPHGFSVDDEIAFLATGALPTGISEKVRYYVGTIPSTTTFTVSTTASNGTPVAVTASSPIENHAIVSVNSLLIPAYVPDKYADSIIAKVTNNAGTYELEPYYSVSQSNDTPLTLVSSLPASGNYVGEAVLLTTTNTIYTWTGSAWDESAGLSVTTVNAYQRSTTLPSTPTGGSFNFSTNTLTPPTGWSASVPSGTDPIYVVSSGASVTGTSGTDSSLDWTTPIILAQDGVDGVDGATGPAGADGADGPTGPAGTNGTDGDDGKQVASGQVYYQLSSASAPSTPSATSYTFATGAFSGLTTNWSTSPPTFEAGNSNKYWFSTFTVQETTAGGGTGTPSFTASSQGFGFSGLVTFSGTELTDGTSTYNPASVINNNVTTVNGGKITTNSITANTLTLGNTTGNDRMKLYDDGIDIYNGGVLRVRIGNLSPTGRS